MMSKDKVVYLMVPKRLIITWIITSSILFLGVVGSVGFTIYNSQKLCGVVNLFNEAYKDTPPTTALGREIASEMAKLRKSYRCI